MPRRVIRLLPSPGAAPPTGALASVVAHVLIGLAVVGAPFAGSAVMDAWDELPEGLRFLVPPSTTKPAAARDLAFDAGAGDGGRATALREDPFGARRAGAAAQSRGTGTAAPASAMDAAAEAAAMNAMLASAYQLIEVDSAAVRDPSSAAPAYPPELEARGIEGHVILRFVVDSTGLADLTTVLTVESTHPLFDRAVRNALPKMRFRPAKVGDRAVRQLAEQLFAFQVLEPEP
jgi:TonB family protein